MINKNPLRRVFCVCKKDRIHSERAIPVWLPAYGHMPEPITPLARLIGISWAWDGNPWEATGSGYQRPAIEFRQPDPATSKTHHNAAAMLSSWAAMHLHGSSPGARSRPPTTPAG